MIKGKIQEIIDGKLFIKWDDKIDSKENIESLEDINDVEVIKLEGKRILSKKAIKRYFGD